MFLRAAPAEAHAFGARYDLPLPLELYLAGAGAAVALSFVIMALVFRVRPAHTDGLRIDLLRFGPMRDLASPCGDRRSSGRFGRSVPLGPGRRVVRHSRHAREHRARVRLDHLVGGTRLCGCVSWQPMACDQSLVHHLCRVREMASPLRVRTRPGLGLAYPSWLGVWPGVALFGLFAWVELISEGAEVPSSLATLVLIYSGLTWFAMAAFGRNVWLAHGEAFSLAFGVLGRFAPFGAPERASPNGRPSRWYFRPYASGLVVETPCHLSMTVFVLLMLATVTFDGFKETPLWVSLLGWIALAAWSHPLLLELHDLGFDLLAVLETVMLALFPLLFLSVYLGFCWLAREASDSERSVLEISGLFVFSLVPIAIAYHLAHYLSYLLIAGQLIIPLASDPFGIGWNLFGTAGYDIDISIIGAKFVWYTAVVTIVVGHVFAVGVAHFVALRAFETPGAALASQYPFLVLMVAYTMVSLWILAQPIVESPNLSSLRAPSGTLSLAPFEFQEVCFEMAALDEIQYDFEADRPVEFDIHYHEGFTIHFVAELNGITVNADKFVAEVGRSYCLRWTNESLMRTSLTYHIVGT